MRCFQLIEFVATFSLRSFRANANPTVPLLFNSIDMTFFTKQELQVHHVGLLIATKVEELLLSGHIKTESHTKYILLRH